jgi:hypothetical protein
LLLPLFNPTTNVISTEGGAFAAEVEDPCISPLSLPVVIASLNKAKSYAYKKLPSNPTAKSHVKPQNLITKRKQTISRLQKSYLQSTTIELEIKKAPAKSRGFPIKPITRLERRIYP